MPRPILLPILAASLLTTALVTLPGLAAPAKGSPEDPHAAAVPEGGEHHGPGHINMFYGLIGEKEGLKQGNLLWRPKGMPPPFGAWLFNTAVLFYFVGRFSARPVSEALKKRKTGIMQGIEEASRMKQDAADRLAGYEEKLEHVDEEIERVKREMRAAGEAERVRVLDEAREKRERLERDARLLIDQELKAVRALLLRETVSTAIRSAAETLSKQVSEQDHERLAQEYLAALDRVEINARGGSA
jgi:F-type H+-transporting ATPase subunit b